jgi:DNA-binding MarR family transcriptional regulator
MRPRAVFLPLATQKSDQTIASGIKHFSAAIAHLDPLRFRAWGELGLTTAQLRVLFMMRAQPGVTAGELATRLAVTPPTISGIVDRLVRLELVRREDDELDRRLVRNHLTRQGEDACSSMERTTEIFARRIFDEMSDEDLDALVAGLRAFVKASDLVARLEPNAPFMPGPRSGEDGP